VITLFAIPKAFEGHAGLIQRNAVASWTRLAPEVEVILIGDEPGVDAAAESAGIRHLPSVARSKYGTPLLSSAFALAREASTRRLLAYANADIVLLQDFVDAVRRIRLERFLCLGRRWNVDVTEELEVDDGYEARVHALVAKSGELALPDAIDYFVFDRAGPLTELPPFVVGRPGWDNWMIHRARSLGLPVVDATRAVTAVHQNHDYAHVPERSGYRWYGPEASANFALIEGLERFQTRHATHVMTRIGLLPALTPRRIVSRVRSRHAVDGSVERAARLVERLALRKEVRR
jgi:hypothetical protein